MHDYNLWKIIVNGPHTPTIIVNGTSSPKPAKDWDETNKKLVQLNAKTMNVLYYALDTNEFNQIFTCNSIKKI